MTTPRDILDFWFEPSDGPDFKQSREKWFGKDAALNAEVARRFLDAHRLAAHGGIDSWAETAESSLALVILLDQFSRNMFRGQPRAFATDAKALGIARRAVRHRDIVARFGRFPHRNAILGRDGTAEERAFLEQPDSSF